MLSTILTILAALLGGLLWIKRPQQQEADTESELKNLDEKQQTNTTALEQEELRRQQLVKSLEKSLNENLTEKDLADFFNDRNSKQ